jgi:hypothetical protein
MSKQNEQTVLRKSKKANKSMNQHSTYLAIKEMQIKTTIGIHLTTVTIAHHRENKQKQMLVRMQGDRNPHAMLVGM